MTDLPSTRPEGNVIRTADLLGAFSLASDLAMGLHMEHGARSCYIGMHIAQEMQLPLEQRFGYAYFMDSVVPHRTVKQGGQIRVTLEFRIRRRTTEEEKAAFEAEEAETEI